MTTLPANPSPGSPPPSGALRAVSGVQLAQGIGVQEAKGFWADAWDQVIKRLGARFALAWLGVVAAISVAAPFIASGHPWVYRELDGAGNVVKTSSPLLRNLTAADVALALGLLASVVWMVAARRLPRSERLASIAICGVCAGLTLVLSALLFSQVRGSEDAQVRGLVEGMWTFRVPVVAALAALMGGLGFMMLPIKSTGTRLGVVGVAGLIAVVSASVWWQRPLQTFPYRDAVAAGQAQAVFTLIPFSPGQRDIRGDFVPPGGTGADRRGGQSRTGQAAAPATPAPDKPTHVLGTDSFGQDVLSQMLHACRLSISIGLVSTGIAVMIGVTIGALMGYFGGWVDLLLYRVVEIFMSVPVLFLLIVAAAVLPRNTYVMMAIIGCVTWTGAARFTRAEFLRLRNQDFVQAAQALGLPLRSILFKHMLPNGVTPVLVDASFAVAAAILAEATLSFLGLGPEEQASWGRLLSDATNNAGNFIWWLAIFPGLAIFLSVLSYNLLGEALRDAIDPKLKKARV